MKRIFPVAAAILLSTIALFFLLFLTGQASPDVSGQAQAALPDADPAPDPVEAGTVPDIALTGDPAFMWGEPSLAGYWDFRMLSDGQGGVYVAWSPGTGNIPNAHPPYDGRTYVQHYDRNGNRLWGSSPGLWGTEDLLLSSTDQREGLEALIPVNDGADGVIVVWQVDEGFDGVYSDVRAQRILLSGAQDWQPGGVPVVTSVPYLDYDEAVPDGQGGVLLVWSRCDNPNNATRCEVRAQRILADGTRAWAAEGVPLSYILDNEELWICWAQSDGRGGAYVIWEETRDSNTLARVQHVDGQGNVRWTGDAHSFPLCFVDGVQVSRSKVIALEQGYYSDHLDLYLFNLEDGTAEWGPITVEAENSEPGSLTSDGRGGAYVTWIGEEDPSSPYFWGARAHHIDGKGQLLWDEPVQLGPGYRGDPQIAPDGIGGAYVAWSGPPSTLDGYALRVQHIDAGGWNLWPTGGAVITEEVNSPRLQPGGIGEGFLAWTAGPDYWWQGHERDYPFYMQLGFTHLCGQVDDGFMNPVPGAQVTLRQGGTTLMTTTTSNAGFYSFNETITGTNLSVRVTLQDGDQLTPTFRIRYGLNNDFGAPPVVYVETAPFSLTISGSFVKNIDFRVTPTLTTAPGIPKGRLDDLATIYYHTWQAAQLAVNHAITLDRRLPVDVYAYAITDTGNCVKDACYWSVDASIGPYIILGANASERTQPDQPGNREWHEFGHHVMGDAFGDQMPQSPPGDKNHGGYWINAATVDSWAEGWAEFWSLLVADEVSRAARPELYRVGASVLNLEDNWPAWKSWGGMTPEELAVASTLWDLYDAKKATDLDAIDLTADQVLNILVSDDYSAFNPPGSVNGYPFDVLTVYSAVVSYTLEYGYTVTDVNTTFITHGLFYDANCNQKWEPGEIVGRVAYTGCTTHINRPGRRNQPLVEGSYVAYTAHDVETGTPLTVTDFLVSVNYAAPFEDHSYTFVTHRDLQTPGLLYSTAPPPGYSATIVITPLLSWHQALNPFSYSTEFYWEQMDLLPTTSFAEHTFELERLSLVYLPIVLKDY